MVLLGVGLDVGGRVVVLVAVGVVVGGLVVVLVAVGVMVLVGVTEPLGVG